MSARNICDSTTCADERRILDTELTMVRIELLETQRLASRLSEELIAARKRIQELEAKHVER